MSVDSNDYVVEAISRLQEMRPGSAGTDTQKRQSRDDAVAVLLARMEAQLREVQALVKRISEVQQQILQEVKNFAAVG